MCKAMCLILSTIHVNQTNNKGGRGKGEYGGRTPTKAIVRKVGGERRRKKEKEGGRGQRERGSKPEYTREEN